MSAGGGCLVGGVESRGGTVAAPPGRLVKLRPILRLYILGAALFAALVIWARYRGRDGPFLFLAPLAVASVAYLLSICEFSRTTKYPRHVVLVCLGLSVLWRVPFLLMPAGPQDDLHRYVWDGTIQRLGYNPYNAIPSDPALIRLHTPETLEMNNPDVASPYPAGAELFFRAVTAVSESTVAFKVALVTCDLLIIPVLFDMLRRGGHAGHWVLAYAWHPLVAIDVAGGGHIDILGTLLLVISVAAPGHRWRAIAGIAFGLAVAVKFLPIVLIPLYWRRLRIRDGVLAALAFVLPYVPFLERGRIPIGSVGTYVQYFRFNGPIFAAVERVTSATAAASLAILAGLVTAIWLRKTQRACSTDEWPWPMAVSLACAPVVYPWYLLWLVPFLRALSTLPLMIWSLSVLSTYFVWYLHERGHRWQVPASIMLLEYGCPVVAAAIVSIQRRARAAAPRPAA
jgi:alpha-1,6-mannosyltransferase